MTRVEVSICAHVAWTDGGKKSKCFTLPAVTPVAHQVESLAHYLPPPGQEGKATLTEPD